MRDCPLALDTAIANAARTFGHIPTPHGVSFHSELDEQPRATERHALARCNRKRYERLAAPRIHLLRQWLQREGESPAQSDGEVAKPGILPNSGLGIQPPRHHKSGSGVVPRTAL